MMPNRYAVYPEANRFQLFLLESDGTKTPLWPTYESAQDAADEMAARERRDLVLNHRVNR